MPSIRASRARSECGQAMVEWAGVLVLVALIVAVVSATGLAGQVASGLSRSVAGVFAGTAHTPAAANPPSAPGSSSASGASPAAGPSGGSVSGGRAAAGAATPGWRWPASAGNHADQLPTGGGRPYSPPKQGRGNPVRTRGGFLDEDGNVWEWAPPGAQHGGPHWDVQHPDGSHTNVAPDGTVIGKDNFPNKRRVPTPPPPPDQEPGEHPGTAKSVAVGAAGAAGAGALIWWLGKLASPACGPLAPLCAIGF